MTFPWLVLAVLGVCAASALAVRFTRQHMAVAIAAGAGILLLHGRAYFDYTSDDAYISYRYARNFSDGIGLVFNDGDRVEGYSNFLWTLLLAGFDRAGSDIVPSATWAGFALAVLTIAGAYLLTTRLLEDAAGRTAGVFAALLLAAAGPFALWSMAGLETSLFALLIVAGVLLHGWEYGRRSVPLSGVVWAAVALTRPDGLLLFAVSAAFKLAEAALRARDDRSRLGGDIVRLLIFGASFAAIFAPYYAWRWDYYGHPFPNTYYAKVDAGIDQYERGLRHLGAFTREHAAWLLLLVPVAASLGAVQRRLVWHPLALVLAWCAYVVYIGGDSLVRFRFFAPLLPLMYPLIAASAAGMLGQLRVRQHLGAEPSRRTIDAAILVAAAALIGSTLHSSATGFDSGAFDRERQSVRDRIEIGRWLRDNVPDDTVVAVVPVGAIPYESRLRTVDMLGITDEHIAHRKLDLGRFPAGHEKYDSEYVLDREPDIIILLDGLTARPWTRDDYSVFAGVIIPAIVDMVNNPRLWQQYEPRGVEVREGAWANLLVRSGNAPLQNVTLPAPAP